MENEEDLIRSLEELVKKLLTLKANNEAFTINVTFNSARGIRSVFFIGGKVNIAMLGAHAESFDAMLKTIDGHKVEAESFITKKQSGEYEKNADGSFKLTFKKNGEENKV